MYSSLQNVMLSLPRRLGGPGRRGGRSQALRFQQAPINEMCTTRCACTGVADRHASWPWPRPIGPHGYGVRHETHHNTRQCY